MTSPLPRYLVFKSKYNNKCVRYVTGVVKEFDAQLQGLFRFDGEDVGSTYSKFEVEVAKTGNGLVHLRCCCNNKYWARNNDGSEYIGAVGDEPEEDQAKSSCTLFEPINIDAQTIRLRHVQLGNYVSLRMSAIIPYTNCACADKDSTDELQSDAFRIIDWESLVILPKHVAFRGAGGYLKAYFNGDHTYLKFEANDMGDSTVGNEVFITGDGSVRIKSNNNGKFWRRSPNWIWADSSDSTDKNADTLFWPVKVDSNIVALRNQGNNLFCKRLTDDGMTSCLNASSSTISNETHLEVHELVLSREIYNVDFHLTDARIYNQQVISMTNGTANNKTQEPNTVDVKLAYTESKSSMWNASVSLTLGVTTSIQTGIPVIGEGKIEITEKFTGAYEWGNTKSSETVEETVYAVIVPPMSTVKVSLLATKGSCDVPFSYTQRDTLIDGQQIISNMNDGIYNGVNSFNFKYETEQIPL